MATLILHIGPPKCGSSSIQTFFANQKSPCFQNTNYKMLNPKSISELNHIKSDQEILDVFSQRLSKWLSECDNLIISHEYLFQCPYAIKNICELANNVATKIFVVGYTRRQSDIIISAYSQWDFRSKPQLNRSIDILEKLKIDPFLFSGLEQHLIAGIVEDFYNFGQLNYTNYSKTRLIDWYESYNYIVQLIFETNSIIKIGVLPNKHAGISLLEDFCEKVQLKIRDQMVEESKKIVNVSYNGDVVEAVFNAVALGFDMPGPHEKNDFLDLLTEKMNKKSRQNSVFIANLKTYIDSIFLSSNHKLCQEYGLNESYFECSEQFNKKEILNLIKIEGDLRASNKSLIVRDYRKLSANMVSLCLKLLSNKDEDCLAVKLKNSNIE